MDTVLIVGAESRAKSDLAQRLSARLGQGSSSKDWHRHQPRNPNVVTVRLVEQHDGVLSIDPRQSILRWRKPILVVLVRHTPLEQESGWIVTDLAEEACALALCASASVPLRILTSEEAVEPTVVPQIAQVVATLSEAQHESVSALEQDQAEVGA